jgi:hypothetical protein
MKPLITLLCFALVSPAFGSSTLEELAKRVESDSLFNSGFLVVTDKGIKVDADSQTKKQFDLVEYRGEGLTEYARDPRYTAGKPKKQFFVQEWENGKTEILAEVTNYNGERYARVLQFGFDGVLWTMTACMSNYGCLTVDKLACEKKTPVANSPHALSYVKQYASLFYAMDGQAAKSKLDEALDYCSFIK